MKSLLLTLATSLLLAGAALAGPRFFCCDYGGSNICIVAAEGSIEWRVDAKNP